MLTPIRALLYVTQRLVTNNTASSQMIVRLVRILEEEVLTSLRKKDRNWSVEICTSVGMHGNL